MIQYFLKEEFRRFSYTMKKSAMFLTTIYFFAAGFMVILFKDYIIKLIGYNFLFQASLISVFLFGVGVGAFGFIGNQYWQIRNKEFYLVSTPETLPISYKSTFLLSYIRDFIYYSFFNFIPLILGLFAGSIFIKTSLFTLSFISLFLFLSFLEGMALSFLLSLLFSKNRKVFYFVSIVITIVILLSLRYNILLSLLVPAYFYIYNMSISLIFTIIYIFIFTFIGYNITPREFEIKMHRYRHAFERFQFKIFRKYAVLMSKEFIDILRGDMFLKLLFSYYMPVLFISLLITFMNLYIIHFVGFSALFFAVTISLFSVVIYSWLVSLDDTTYYNYLPVTQDKLINAHIISYMILSSIVSVPVILFITLYFNELALLIVVLLIFFINSFYLLTVTIYFTGLKTGSLLFDPSVFGKFMTFSITGSIILAILGNMSLINIKFLFYLLIILAVLLILSYVFYNKSIKKWSVLEF